MPRIPRFQLRISETRVPVKVISGDRNDLRIKLLKSRKVLGLWAQDRLHLAQGADGEGGRTRMPSLPVRGCPCVYPCGSTAVRAGYGMSGSKGSGHVRAREHGRPSPDTREGMGLIF